MMTMKLKITVLIILILFSPVISTKGDSLTNVIHQPLISQTDLLNIEGKTSVINPQAIDKPVVVIVESGLWGDVDIRTAVNQYVNDINDTGYDPILYTSAIANAQLLRALLIGWHNSDSIIGAVLIGDLPYAEFYHDDSVAGFPAEDFICDLYLMDLDGTWQDLEGSDGIFDSHTDGSGDIEPEIFVGRLDASTRTFGSKTNAEDIIDLLSRVHAYRYGGVARRHRALMYIDDDWAGQYTWPDWPTSIYPETTTVNIPTTYTNGTDWLNRIQQNYEFGHLCAHSSSTAHYFPPYGEGDIVPVSAIHATRPSFNFYSLFNCHGSDFSDNDCLGITYLFSSDYSLAVVSSAKTGGMLGGGSFYYTLSQSKSIGEGLHNWFQGMTSYSSNYVEWFYGMNILGDPFLKPKASFTHLTPTIYSTTHPDTNTWYSNDYVELNWTEPENDKGIEGYYYILNKLPNTIPDEISGTYTKSNGTSSTFLFEGTWYLHVVVVDGDGNIGKIASHYRIQYDKTTPSLTLINPIANSKLKPETFVISWDASDSASGLDYFEIRIDDSMIDIVNNETTFVNAILYKNGLYQINVTAYDKAGFSNSVQITIEIFAFSQTLSFKILLGLGIPIVTIAIAGGIFLGIRKKKLAP